MLYGSCRVGASISVAYPFANACALSNTRSLILNQLNPV